MDSMNTQFPNYPVADQQQPPVPPTITPMMMEYFKQTKPWVRFMSVLGFINTGLLFLGGLFLILGAGLLSSLSSTPFGGAPAALVGIVYAVIGCLYFFPALFLFRYADGIKKALTIDQPGGVEDALRSQKSFWRFVGIFALIVLILVVLGLVFVILAVIFGGLSMR